MLPERVGQRELAWHEAANAQEPDGALELWWESRAVMSVSRISDRDLPEVRPVGGAIGEFVAHVLDDATVRQMLSGERFALVRLPRGYRASDFVRTVDGRSVSVVRDAGGKFGRLPTVVTGAGTGAGIGTAVAAAPAIAAAVGAAWAHQQLSTAMTSIREGMERISVRLDDRDHGVLAAAQAHIGELSGLPSTWRELDVLEMAQHRAALDGVYHTAKRRADRRFAQLEGREDIPKLDGDEVAEIRRDFVLRVDAELVAGQMDLVRAIALMEADSDAGLIELAAIEERLSNELAGLAARMSAALDLELPGRLRPGSRKSARELRSQVSATLGGLRELLDELQDEDDIELLVEERHGELVVHSIERPTLALDKPTDEHAG